MPKYKDIQTGEILTQEEFDGISGESNLIGSKSKIQNRGFLEKIGLGVEKVAKPLATVGEFLGMKPLGTYIASKFQDFQQKLNSHILLNK